MDRAQRFSIRRYTSLDAMKADEYQYWQSRPAYERLAATSELSSEAYRIKDPTANVSDTMRWQGVLHANRPGNSRIF
jgi:hypothetical protein